MEFSKLYPSQYYCLVVPEMKESKKKKNKDKKKQK